MTAEALFINRSRYYLNTEYRTKLRLAVMAIPDERIWWRPNDASNSVANLLLHLAGNIRQWVVSGVGGASFSRDRAGEFAARGGASREQLLEELERALDEVDSVLEALPPVRFAERAHVQGRDLCVLEVIYHVVEHFGYHLGQIVQLSKQVTPAGVRFYEDAAGLARPIWNR